MMASVVRFQSIVDEILGCRFTAESKYLLPEDRIDWSALSGSGGPEAVDLLAKNPDKIDWSVFSGNSHPAAVALLQHPEKIDWVMLKMLEPIPAELISWGLSNAAIRPQNDFNMVLLYVNKNPDAIEFLLKKT